MTGSIIPEKKSRDGIVLRHFFPSPIKIYLHHAVSLTIALGNPASLGWFYSNYIQICNNVGNAPFADEYFQFFPHSFAWNGCPLLDVKWGYFSGQDEVIEVCRHWIKEGFYLDFDILDFYLPGTLGYKKDRQSHQCLIFGYDDKAQELYSVNFDQRRNFAVIRHSYTDFNTSFEHTVKYMGRLHSYLNGKYSLRIIKATNAEYRMSIPALKRVLVDYLSSNNSADDQYYAAFIPKKNYTHWGLDVIQYLREYVGNLKGKAMDYRAFHGLWEHKCVMLDRVKYLRDNNIAAIDEGLIEGFDQAEKQAHSLRTRVIQYCISFEKEFLAKIDGLLDDILQKDKVMIEKLVAVLG